MAKVGFLVKKWHWWTACACVIVCGWGVFYTYTSPSDAADFSSETPENKRPLELSAVSGKSDKTNEETKVILNDPAISQAWGLKKSAAAKAWEVSQGSKDIVVAVIDTGIDVKHEDLKNNLWRNPGETGLDAQGRDKATNGIDDDGNGFKDDVYGWNFVSNRPDLTDNHGHGTHIAGIIGAEASNGVGIAGISPKVSLMILKYFDPKVPGTDNLRNTIQAIKYAVKMKANIINYSGGGTEFSADERAAIAEAEAQGILFVAAAGNERSNSDKFKYYPADYGLSNIISVTAIDPSTEVLASSNYGTETVDLGAPGQNILSTLPGNSYGYMTGTSQATAFVTGAAVLVMAHRQYKDPVEVKKYILATGDSDASLIAKTRTSKQLNLFKAVTMLDSGIGVSGVVATNTNNGQQFPSDPNMASDDPNRGIATFGRNLVNSIEGLSKAAQEVPHKKRTATTENQ